MFKLRSDFKPTGDQPHAIDRLVEGLNKNYKHQTLLGVTGSGKTFVVANTIAKINKATLIISHNKTLAAQLYQEFKQFFPQNTVCYFVSYYDYYLPESYLPQTDTYIEKETEINEEIDKLRLATTTALSTRKDVIVVASVSAIYNLGSPAEYERFSLPINVGQTWLRRDLLGKFTKLQYFRNDTDFVRGSFRIRGESIEIYPSYLSESIKFEFDDDKLVGIKTTNPLSGEISSSLDKFVIYPAKHFMTSQDVIKGAIENIQKDLLIREKELKKTKFDLYAYRLRQKTMYDIESMVEFGYCKGIENYSRYFDGRQEGEPPFTLIDYFPKDYLLVIDESHITIPQIRGMYRGDRARKETLINYGFRLPSALDNRPLTYEEFSRKVNKAIYTSATPNEYEMSLSNQVVETLIRPTGLIDPIVKVKPTENQISDLISEIEKRVSKKERVLVTTLTKRMAEDLSEYLSERKIKVNYLHSEIETLDRIDILDDLRIGKYDVIVGINLLREGLDLPEVSLVVILDADKEGFLRSETSLIQTMGRAARHKNGEVIMYADTLTKSMKGAIAEVERRRNIQLAYNKIHHIKPKGIEKPIREKLVERQMEETDGIALGSDLVIGQAIKRAEEGSLLADDKQRLIKILSREMKEAAKILNFERATFLRDQVIKLKTN